jgi:hypothetical protein
MASSRHERAAMAIPAGRIRPRRAARLRPVLRASGATTQPRRRDMAIARWIVRAPGHRVDRTAAIAPTLERRRPYGALPPAHARPSDPEHGCAAGHSLPAVRRVSAAWPSLSPRGRRGSRHAPLDRARRRPANPGPARLAAYQTSPGLQSTAMGSVRSRPDGVRGVTRTMMSPSSAADRSRAPSRFLIQVGPCQTTQPRRA